MRAINGNDLTRITDSLERIEQLAEAVGWWRETEWKRRSRNRDD
jgi:hypothetical protein